MNLAVFIYFFFINVLLAYSDTAPSTSTALKCPGNTPCVYFGGVENCNEPILPVTSLPDKCTGFFYDGFVIDETFNVRNSYSSHDKEYVTELSKVKPTFAYIGFTQDFNWENALKPGTDLKPQLDNIKTFFNGINISGLVLKSVFKDCFSDLQNITEKLETYVKYMKAGLPGMSFGIVVEATDLKNHIDKMDFTILSTTFEFLMITFQYFNECSNNYMNGGVVPLDGTTGNTLKNFSPFIKRAMVHPMQVILKFEMNEHVEGDTPATCYSTFGVKCSGKKCEGCCMDNSTTLYEKGNFAKTIGASVAASSIDLDDSGCKCGCGFPFPAFTFLLNGFNNGDKTLKCSKFDGTP